MSKKYHAKYIAKCEVWLSIESNYPDGIGEAEREVQWLINTLESTGNNSPNGSDSKVSIAFATNIDIRNSKEKLKVKMGECDQMLIHFDETGKKTILDDGIH